MSLEAVETGALELERFAEGLDDERFAALREAARRGREVFADRAIWNVNSTARGGGVAEMLVSLLAYARGAGIDARWSVIAGDHDFFAVTKRLHNHLHGAEGDGGPLDDAARAADERALEPNAAELTAALSRRDLVILHAPQPAGLIPAVKAAGVPVVWRCHIGLDVPNDIARGAWRFLEPYVMQADAYVFSREAFVWDELDPARRVIIAPSIDVFSPKNAELTPEAVDAVLTPMGLRGLRFVLQVSRWDSLKDPLGVVQGFADHVAPFTDAHLVCAGPDVTAIADDPEGAAV